MHHIAEWGVKEKEASEKTNKQTKQQQKKGRRENTNTRGQTTAAAGHFVRTLREKHREK